MQITTENHYHPGDTIKGAVRIELPRAIKAKKVEVRLLGLESAIFGSGDSTRRETENVVDETIVMWEGGVGGVLGSGISTFPFSFTLPEKALPTLNSQSVYGLTMPEWAAEKGIRKTIINLAGTIEYVLSARIDKPLTLPEKAELVLLVRPFPFPHVLARHLACDYDHPSNNVKIRVEVDACSIARGDAFTGRIVFWKHPMSKVRGVTATLEFQSMASASRFRNQVSSNDMAVQCTDAVFFPVDWARESYTWEFKLKTMNKLPVTVSGKLVKTRWLLDVQADMPMARDPHVRIPVIVLPATATIEAPVSGKVYKVNNDRLELKPTPFDRVRSDLFQR